MAGRVEQWDTFELSLPGPGDEAGHPFVDVTLSACFTHEQRQVNVAGFYDGDGIYRVRFMPETPGAWRYVTQSNRPVLDGVEGEFTCTPATPGNHGPVRVHNRFHFAYADGHRFVPVGTTCYAWNHQPSTLQQHTLATLRASGFNKLRMCVFPKWYQYNRAEPLLHPMARLSDDQPDPTRFNTAYFQHLDRCLDALRAAGIEADLILFHPYDKWGYARMRAEDDDRYLRYVIARYAAYRNVWWSLANEYDLFKHKTMADWDRFFHRVQESDPYQHLRSIHHCRTSYDHTRPWVTHASLQHSDTSLTRQWREQYGKPVIDDECRYEGDVPYHAWGSLSARELVHRFWDAAARGGYVTHGETYMHPQDILWWSHGGQLRGESPPRLAFLRRVLEEAPVAGLDPIDGVATADFPCAGVPGRYYLIYLRMHQPAALPIALPEDGRFVIDVIDTWRMHIAPFPGIHRGEVSVPLPARRSHLAVRIQASEG